MYVYICIHQIYTLHVCTLDVRAQSNMCFFSYNNTYIGDIGAVFGIGFPPFLGGPFRMLDIQGTAKFVDTMKRFRDMKGEQFEPAQILKDYAATGKKFHS